MENPINSRVINNQLTEKPENHIYQMAMKKTIAPTPATNTQDYARARK